MQVRFSHRIFALFGSHCLWPRASVILPHSLCAIPLWWPWSTYCNCPSERSWWLSPRLYKLSLSLSECSLVLGLAFSLIIVPWQHSCEIDVQILWSVSAIHFAGSAAPLLVTEIAFPSHRGQVTSIYKQSLVNLTSRLVTMRSEHFKGFWVVSCKLKTTSLQIFQLNPEPYLSAQPGLYVLSSLRHQPNL